jgi:Reverse transcriptase (RNA-dependent DNA polymerase)
VYIDQPPGFEKKDKENQVYRLLKALYGLKQASRAWYSKIDGFFENCGFSKSMSEPNLFIKDEGKAEFLIVCLYVDDMIYMGTNVKLTNWFKEKMMSTFDMTDLGELHYFLGLEIIQQSGSIFMFQRKYAADLLEKFSIKEAKYATTPMNVNEKLEKEDGSGITNPTRYRSLVGGLVYLTHSRPDLSFAVGMVSRFLQNPTRHHFGTARRILCYVASTIDFGLWYRSSDTCMLEGFSDSDWAGSIEDRRSTSGHVFKLSNAAVSWSSKKQASVVLSSSEAEYTAMSTASCQAVWLRRILTDCQIKQEGPTTIYCDNQSAIAMAHNPVYHARTKHIDIKVHFIRDLVAKSKVKLEYISTDLQVADILTKSLARAKFEQLRNLLGLVSFASRGSVRD